jgi:molecular chaperone IbpA
MSKTLTLRSSDILPKNFHQFAVGFDSIFDELHRSTMQVRDNYPPYNLIKYTEDNFTIEIAVAGFNQGDITVELDKNQLTIKGEQSLSSDNDSVQYLHRGISSRNFVRTFTIADYVEVVNATVENGILSVELERKIPESAKPKTIAIEYK